MWWKAYWMWVSLYDLGIRVKVKSMHDDYIVQYSVNLSEQKLILQMYNNETKAEGKISFSDVLTHSFRCILDYNQILDIDEYGIDSFIVDNKAELQGLKGYCWPINYQNQEELKTFLMDNGYKYIRINSSYGLFGWVLAKSYKIS